MNLNIQTVAEYILAVMREQGDYVSHLKLQKLLYYAQGWFLALHEEPLFPDDCEAWVHGPVYPAIYNLFRDYGWKPILDVPDEKTSYDDIILPENVKEHLDEIITIFGSESAHNLERMTHREMPWVKARKGLPETEPSTAKIAKEDMQKFYKQLSEQEQ